MTSVQPQRRAANKRKREFSAMRILPRPIGALILIVGRGCRLRWVYERLWHRHPSRVAEAPKPAARSAHAPRPASRDCGGSSVDGNRRPSSPPGAHDLSTAGRAFDTWLIKTYLACWKAGAASRATPMSMSRRCASPTTLTARLSKAKLVNPPSDPALKPQAKSVLCRGAELQPASGAGAISPVL